MPRPPRITPGGFVYHVVNRATEGCTIFRDEDDIRMFLHLLRRGKLEAPVRVCGYCPMPTHFHLLLWPETDDAISAYMHWVTTCHSLNYRD